MIGQIFALIVLKLRLMRSTWSAGRATASLILGFALTIGVLLSLTVSAATYYIIANEFELDGFIVLAVLDGALAFFLFFWFFGLMVELQRSDTLDFRKMMYLPVSLRMIFGLNYVVSLFSPALIFFVPPFLAFVLGLSARYGARMLLGIPLVLIFFLMVGAWAYYVRGLLAVVMQNKRRRRLVLTFVPVAFVLLGQLPNLLFSVSRDHFEQEPWSETEVRSAVLAANVYVPFGWLPFGVYSLHEKDLRAALVCLGGLSFLTLGGLGVGYRSTLRFYAEGGNEGRARTANVDGGRTRTPGTLRRLPLLDQESSALTAAAFLSLVRHPNIRMQLVMPIIMGGIMLVLFSQNDTFQEMGGEMRMLSWLPMAVLVWPFMNFAHVFFNQFGIDREAFRGMLLLPTPRHKILLAKNIAIFPFVGPVGLFYLGAAALIFGATPGGFLLSLVLLFQLYFSFCITGNFVSLYLPYRIHHDMMRRPGKRGTVFLTGLLSAGFIGVLMVPITLCLMLDSFAASYGLFAGWPVGLIGAAVLLLLTVVAWRLTLTAAGDLLLAREQQILSKLVHDRD